MNLMQIKTVISITIVLTFIGYSKEKAHIVTYTNETFYGKDIITSNYLKTSKIQFKI